MSNSQRFLDKVEKSDIEKCWNWTASLGRGGYGQFRLNGKNIGAHRASWLIYCGEIPSGLFVLHKCDNPKCVNPQHLFLGDHDDNMRDMNKKGRGKPPTPPSGDAHWTRRNPEKVLRGIAKSKIAARGENHGSKTHPESRPKGQDQALAKLTNQDVISIRKRYANGERGNAEFGKEFGVSAASISYIVNGKTWKHLL